jgi:hypothetical protein
MLAGMQIHQLAIDGTEEEEVVKLAKKIKKISD